MNLSIRCSLTEEADILEAVSECETAKYRPLDLSWSICADRLEFFFFTWVQGRSQLQASAEINQGVNG